MAKFGHKVLAAVVGIGISLSAVGQAWGHCDGEDGPVITEARAAIEAGEVTPVLKWVPAGDEPTIRALFAMTLAVRGESDAARQVADQHFLETLVRLHRAHEGAPFTGILPSGTPVSPAIAKADAALASGEVDALADAVAEAVRAGIKERFAAAHTAQAHQGESVEAGRTFVQHYVSFVHYVKGIHEAATGAGGHGHGAPDAAQGHAAEHGAH